MNENKNRPIYWATSTSNSLKHIIKYGEHKPINSLLLASELTNLFLDLAKRREGDEIPINSNNENGVYFYFLSSTSCNINGNSYRETGAFINNEGLCKVVHFLEHDDTKQFEKKKNEISSFKETILISLCDTFKK